MDLHNTHAYTRRAFLLQGLTLASAAVTVPAFLQRSAFGLPHAAAGLSSIPGVDEGRVLVVLQLSGGNDGLNTVVPFGDPTYYKARTSIGIPERSLIKLSRTTNGIGIHPALRPLAELHDNGMLGIVHGVGYPNPNRSHFKSMDIWHTADTSGTGTGWLGRYVDSECCGSGKGESGRPTGQPAQPAAAPQPAIAIGRDAPLAVQGRIVQPIAFENTDLFRWTGKDHRAQLDDPYETINRRGQIDGVPDASNAAFLMRTALDAQISSDQIRRAVAQRPLVRYPQTDLARQLAMVSAMIRAGLKTRVYYVSQGGYDTHAGQGGENGRHAQLLGQFATALKTFYDDLQAQGNAERVLTMSFSEFGRRVYQNASGGTDHGTAAPLFLAGPMVRPGFLGRYPSLTDLDEGDLKFTTDFRNVYAGILDRWLRGDVRAVLGSSFRPTDILRRA